MLQQSEIIEAVRQILIQLHKLTDAGLPRNQIDRISRETIFFLYEGGERNKWSFDRPHSAAARALHREARSQKIRFRSGAFPITYDHALPLAVLRHDLHTATDSSEGLSSFLIRHVQGVVILKEEDARLSKLGLRSKLPLGASPYDLMARYRAAEIQFEKKDIDMLQRGVA